MLRSAGARRLRKQLRGRPAGANKKTEKCLVDLGRDTRTRTRTYTNPNDTEASAAGRSVRACVARKLKS